MSNTNGVWAVMLLLTIMAAQIFYISGVRWEVPLLMIGNSLLIVLAMIEEAQRS
jgi:hypothetical protein